MIKYWLKQMIKISMKIKKQNNKISQYWVKPQWTLANLIFPHSVDKNKETKKEV
jgi:hypothetical protein